MLPTHGLARESEVLPVLRKVLFDYITTREAEHRRKDKPKPPKRMLAQLLLGPLIERGFLLPQTQGRIWSKRTLLAESDLVFGAAFAPSIEASNRGLWGVPVFGAQSAHIAILTGEGDI